MKDRHVIITNTIRENYISVSVSFENPPSQAEQKQEFQHKQKKKKEKKKPATEEKYKNAP
jgi:hypothetical protein